MNYKPKLVVKHSDMKQENYFHNNCKKLICEADRISFNYEPNADIKNSVSNSLLLHSISLNFITRLVMEKMNAYSLVNL